MQSNDRRALPAFRAMVEFLDRHPVDAVAVEVKQQRDALMDVLTRMTVHVDRRVGGDGEVRAMTASVWELRGRLHHEFLVPVRLRTGVLVAANESLREVLHVTMRKDLVSQLALARSVAAAARENAEAFVAAGLKANYAEQLTALVKELEDTIALRNRRRAEATGSTMGFRQAARQGRQIVGFLDVLLERALKEDEALLREWKALRRRAVWLHGAAAVTEEVAVSSATAGEVTKEVEKAA